MTVRYILKRMGVLVVTLFVISALAFVAFQIIPGDPVTKLLGTQATPERVAAMRAELGLDKPATVRFFKWLSAFVKGDFGQSYGYGISVNDLIGDKIITTATLTVMSFAFVVIISLPLGMILARYSEASGKGLLISLQRAFSAVATILTQVVMAIPPFFIGIIFTFVFGLVLRLFTPGKFVPYTDGFGAFMSYLIFPSLAIALPRSAMAIKMLRGSILSEAKSDYVRSAYSRGGGQWYVLIFHIARNAMIPVVTFLAMTLSDIAAGSIIIEQVFAIPGMGRLLLLSIANRDYPVVQTIVVIIASVVVIVNFLADLAYQIIDPRVRLN